MSQNIDLGLSYCFMLCRKLIIFSLFFTFHDITIKQEPNSKF